MPEPRQPPTSPIDGRTLDGPQCRGSEPSLRAEGSNCTECDPGRQAQRPRVLTYRSELASSLDSGKLCSAALDWDCSIFTSISSYERAQAGQEEWLLRPAPSPRAARN